MAARCFAYGTCHAMRKAMSRDFELGVKYCGALLDLLNELRESDRDECKRVAAKVVAVLALVSLDGMKRKILWLFCFDISSDALL